MQQSYPLSEKQKTALRFKPKKTSCMQVRTLEDLKNCTGTLVFIWLKNNNGFWFYIHAVTGNTLYGYMMTLNMWRYSSVSIQHICSFY
ncbi:MAG: hypothetical protein Q4F95_08575 [Oscillospiraceae bacterium]|nr:hypothetical protein [Oscillospiraceae bacterium]